MLAHITALAATTPDSSAFLLAIVISGFAALIVATMLADRGGLLPRSPVAFGRWTATIAMALSLGAAAIHFAVISEHFEEYAPYGVAFTVLAWFQVGWAVSWVVEHRRTAALAAILVNGGALVVWAVSRTAGLPIGPEPGQLEPVGPLDVLAGILEVTLVALLAWDLGMPSIRYRPALPAAGATLVVGSVALAVVLATSVALASAGESGHHHGGVAEEVAVGDSGEVAVPAPAEPLPSDPAPVVSPSGPPDASPGLPAPSAASASSLPSASAPAASPSPATATARPSATAGSVASRPTPTTRPTPRPATPRPTATPDRHPGVIVFGSALDATGQISQPDNRFREGENAVWIADLSEAPGVSVIRKEIVQVLPDGREFEHWREDISLSDPNATRLVGHAELSLYAHGGVGSYRLRYLRGDELLAEGAFELVP